MKRNPTLRLLIVIGIVLLITYAMADGIRSGSTWGVVMALVSMACLAISIRLARKLRRINSEEQPAEEEQ